MGAPALLDAQAQRVLDRSNDLATYQFNHIKEGVGFAPTTPSAQATGIAGDLDVNIDHGHVLGVVQGSLVEVVAAADLNIHPAAAFWSAISGKSVVMAVVLENSGSPSLATVLGAEADTGSEVSPTDDEITAALGHALWVRACDVTVNRTGDTAVTQSQDNTVRPSVASTNVSTPLATSEAAFQQSGSSPGVP